jgi:hypothetical protein
MTVTAPVEKIQLHRPMVFFTQRSELNTSLTPSVRQGFWWFNAKDAINLQFPGARV